MFTLSGTFPFYLPTRRYSNSLMQQVGITHDPKRLRSNEFRPLELRYFTRQRRIAIVITYNCQLAPGDNTAYQQQYRLLSAHFRSKLIMDPPNPHRQFILDLQSWLSHMIQHQHEIISALDANESYDPDIPGTPHFLPYTGEHIMASSHDGKLPTLVATCSLSDPLACHHPERPFPASH